MCVYILTGLVAFLSLRNYENISNESLSNKRNYQKNLYKYVAIFVCVLVFGLRDYSVGTDTKNYFRIFNGLGDSFALENMIYEKGFCILSIVVNIIFDNYTIFLIISGFIIYYNIINGLCELSESPSLSILCYFGFAFFAESCNLLRQYLALSFCFMALICLLRKQNIIKFFIYIILAMLFHQSAIIFLLVIPIKYIKFNAKSISIMICGSILFTVFLPQIISIFDTLFGSQYLVYIKYQTFSLSNVFILFGTVIVLFLIYYYKGIVEKQEKDGSDYNFFANMYLVFVCFRIISTISFDAITRLEIYFLPSVFFLVPLILSNLKKYKSIAMTNFMTLIFVFILIFILIVKNSYGVIPYTFINFFG